VTELKRRLDFPSQEFPIYSSLMRMDEDEDESISISARNSDQSSRFLNISILEQPILAY